MMVMEQPTPIHKKKSLFRRFTFKEQPAARPIRPVHPLALPSPPPSPPSSIESHPRSSGKLQRRSSSAPLTPPASPKEPEKEMPRRKQHIQKSSISRPRLIVQDNHPIATKLPLFEFEQNHQYRPKSQHARHDSAQSSASSASRTTAHSKSTSTSTSQSPASTSTSSIRLPSPSLPPPPPGTHNGRVLPHARPARPFSSHPNITPWNVFLPPSHTHALYLGALPTSSSERWFIYSEGPDALGKLKVHFHRSGNGQKIAELFVVMDVKGEGAGKIVGIKWDAGWETNRMSESEAKLVVREACVDMLGVQLEAGF